MSRLLPPSVLGFVLGVLITGVLALWVLSGRLDSGLDQPLRQVRSADSPPSRLHDAGGDALFDFVLVQPVEVAASALPPLLVEAFLVAAPSAFYEPRVRDATSRAAAVLGALEGRAPTASPLSVELARVLLVGEPAGMERRVREELLSTRLDADTTVSERAAAWLDWVPLCHGQRGALAARRDCLGTEAGEWSPAEAASVAVAAARSLDLADDSELLGAARDAVLERLVRRGLAKRDAFSQSFPPGVSSSTPCVREVRSEVRRAVGESWGQAVRVDTSRDRLLTDLLEEASPGGSWLFVNADGDVTACRGAGTAGLRAPVGPPGPEAGVERAAAWALAVAGQGRPVLPRWTGSVHLDGRELPRSAPTHTDRVLSPERAFHELLGFEPAGRGLRTQRSGRLVTVVHPSLAGAVLLDDPAQAAGLAERLVRRVPEARFAVPDRAEVVLTDAGPELRMRDGGPLPR